MRYSVCILLCTWQVASTLHISLFCCKTGGGPNWCQSILERGRSYSPGIPSLHVSSGLAQQAPSSDCEAAARCYLDLSLGSTGSHCTKAEEEAPSVSPSVTLFFSAFSLCNLLGNLYKASWKGSPPAVTSLAPGGISGRQPVAEC